MSLSKPIPNVEQIIDTRSMVSNNRKRREAEIEMTTLKPSSSVGFSTGRVQPKTLAELQEEIVSYSCPDSSCTKGFGGYYLNNFRSSSADGNILMDNSAKLLRVFREKTRLKTKEEKENFSILLFKTHCKNLSEVVDRASAVDVFLHGRSTSTTTSSSTEGDRSII